MKTIDLSDEQYDVILRSAQVNHKTPEEVIDEMIGHLIVGRAENEEDFYRQMGATEEQIQAIVQSSSITP